MRERTTYTGLKSWGLMMLVTVACSTSFAETRFTIVDSHPNTWVARGLSDYTVTEADGWSFVPDIGSFGRSNDVSIRVTGPPLPAAPSVGRWEVTFSAPFDAPLEVGLYEDATRFPFDDSDEPGMDFSSTGRGDNRLLADFDVLEISFEPNGDLASLAVDFTYYGEERLDEPTFGEIRFNAIPEPAFRMVWLGVLATLRLRRWRLRD